MNEQSMHYAILRDRKHWDEVVSVGLEPQKGGALVLMRIPGFPYGKAIVSPASPSIKPSGIAVGACHQLYIANTDHHCILKLDSLCNVSFVLPDADCRGNGPGQFSYPRGLLLAHDSLYVADSGNRRIQVYRLPSLELRWIWEGDFTKPTALAADSLGHIYVLDGGSNSIQRYGTTGVPDDEYNVRLSDILSGLSPISLAIDGRDTLHVSITQPTSNVLRIDASGKRLDDIIGNKPQKPGAMAANGNRLYVADDCGEIWVLDCAAGIFLGTLSDYRGSVAALALDGAGALYIKPGTDDEKFHKLQENVSCTTVGYLTAGPFDAGKGCKWERVHAELDLPEGAGAELHLITADSSSATPLWNYHPPTYSMDTLVSSLTAPRRYLWLRVLLYSDDRRRVSPILKQVKAATTARSYLEHLPAVYGREDASTHFLERWLALFRAELGDLELALDEMPIRFDPVTAPESDLHWLASWLAFDPPKDLDGDELRSLLQRVRSLYERRGTLQGLGDFIELYVGVRPSIFEDFKERHVWQLGYTSTLGCNTALAAGLPDGMILPGFTLADPGYFGLRGDYYKGIDLRAHVLTRNDPIVSFHWDYDKPAPLVLEDWFSVRWTGQVLPRYSERYTFHVRSDDGIRLWVNGILIIDKWIDQSPTDHSSTISLDLEANRWYSIQLEYYEKTGIAVIELYWSSRSQLKEIIPQNRLYSVRDETAQTELPELSGAPETLLVGQTVIGECGPLDQSNFGMPLFSETAHLFTVSIPAGALREPAEREVLRQVIETEKPAHTDYHLCFVEPTLRVGFQARLGIDTIVAGPPPAMDLAGAVLGLDSYMSEDPTDRDLSRVGKQTHLGQDTQVS